MTAQIKQSSPAPARAERQARLMKIVNVPMRLVLSLPFPTPLSRNLMLLTYTGRKSGKVYHQPVSYVPDGDTLLTPGGGRWKLNLRDGQPIHIRLRGRDVTARPEKVRDIAEIQRLIGVMKAKNPNIVRFIPFIDSNGTIDRAKLDTALRYGFCIVRWHLDSAH
ncbi:MAG TPA: nitroreductase/quinone reductase family protein [Thermomicrobiaceae bacterium]|nr:nitroreductase/quinone reductase family protein [Thermomicrobiaceae bacterium]